MFLYPPSGSYDQVENKTRFCQSQDVMLKKICILPQGKGQPKVKIKFMAACISADIITRGE
jgi:hypothetical protein